MDFISLSFPFLIGVFSFFSPCTFPLVPGYVGYLMGGRGDISLTRGALYGAICVTGILVSTAILGFVAATLRGFFTEIFFWIRLVASLGIAALGVVFLASVEIVVPLRLGGPRRGRGAAGFFFYGMFYGPAVFACNFPLFTALFLFSLTALDVVESFLTFIVYGLGLGLPLLFISMATAKARQVFVRKASRYYPWIQRVSGVVLISVGIYLALETLPLLA